MSPLFPVVLLLCAASAFCALPQDANNFLDVVLRDRVPAELRSLNLDPAQIPDFSVKVKKTFLTNRDLKADFTSGKVFGLSQVRRRGDCGAPFWEGTNSTFRCHLSLDGVRAAYQVKAKGHKALGSTSYSVDMFVENTNFVVEVTSARSQRSVLKSVSVQSLSLKINESSNLGLNKDRKKKYHEAIKSNVQGQLTGLLYGGFRDALNRAVNAVIIPFPFL
ncbi:salivary anticoagulant protein P23-like isoform X2 [Amblyomma americanum]|uniref:Sulfotransferase n=1 Tax=Amblyomma americanum TaxID=6943 RepID=A0AAQ4DAS1_AMBAM